MILVPASDCLQHKFGANCLNGRNLNVRTVEVQLDSVADTKLAWHKDRQLFLNNGIEYRKATFHNWKSIKMSRFHGSMTLQKIDY